MDLLASYSNRPELADDLERVVARLRKRDEQDKRMSVQSAQRRPCKVEDRLSEEQIASLIAEYRAGTIAKELAEKYEISLSSVKRLLRRRGGRLKDR